MLDLITAPIRFIGTMGSSLINAAGGTFGLARDIVMTPFKAIGSTLAGFGEGSQGLARFTPLAALAGAIGGGILAAQEGRSVFASAAGGALLGVGAIGVGSIGLGAANGVLRGGGSVVQSVAQIGGDVGGIADTLTGGMLSAPATPQNGYQLPRAPGVG